MLQALETLRTNLLACPARIAECERSADVLDRLDDALGGCHKLRVLGAGRFPVKSGDWDRIKLGETAFKHRSVPAEWWREYLTLARVTYDPIVMLARVSLAPFTWSEGQTMLDLVGADRWVHELCLKYGMRDGFTCPIGARWMVSYWSPQSLTNCLSSETRAALYTAASSAAIRLEQLLSPGAGGVGDRASLTPRELAVLRWASLGRRVSDTALALGLSTETVRTHMRKAQEKLGAHNSAHAVAEAMRLRFFP
jgi:DNA-binding CsgD family transcriptional regulator